MNTKREGTIANECRLGTVFLNSQISFLPQVVDEEFGSMPAMAMATDMDLCQE